MNRTQRTTTHRKTKYSRKVQFGMTNNSNATNCIGKVAISLAAKPRPRCPIPIPGKVAFTSSFNCCGRGCNKRTQRVDNDRLARKAIT